jgi:hypothetical protein
MISKRKKNASPLLYLLRAWLYPKQKIYAWLKIKKVEHMKGGIMCHPRTRKSSTADQRKHEKDTNQHISKSIQQGNIPFQEVTQKKPLKPYLIALAYKRGTGKEGILIRSKTNAVFPFKIP